MARTRDSVGLSVRGYQRDILRELSSREERYMTEVLDDVLWYGWKGLGYNISEIEKGGSKR